MAPCCASPVFAVPRAACYPKICIKCDGPQRLVGRGPPRKRLDDELAVDLAPRAERQAVDCLDCSGSRLQRAVDMKGEKFEHLWVDIELPVGEKLEHHHPEQSIVRRARLHAWTSL